MKYIIVKVKILVIISGNIIDQKIFAITTIEDSGDVMKLPCCK